MTINFLEIHAGELWGFYGIGSWAFCMLGWFVSAFNRNLSNIITLIGCVLGVFFASYFCCFFLLLIGVLLYLMIGTLLEVIGVIDELPKSPYGLK